MNDIEGGVRGQTLDVRAYAEAKKLPRRKQNSAIFKCLDLLLFTGTEIVKYQCHVAILFVFNLLNRVLTNKFI